MFCRLGRCERPHHNVSRRVDRHHCQLGADYAAFEKLLASAEDHLKRPQTALFYPDDRHSGADQHQAEHHPSLLTADDAALS